MEKRELICIGCPMGCPLTVEMNGTEVVSVTGNTCPRGDAYARKEVTESYKNCNFHCKSRRWKSRHGFCKDKGRYSERKDFRVCKSTERRDSESYRFISEM